MAADLVTTGQDVLVTNQSPAVPLLMRATATLPIVMLGVADPVVNGFVASLAHQVATSRGLPRKRT